MERVTGVDWSLTKTGVGVVTKRVDGSTIANGAVLRHPWTTGEKARAKAGLPARLSLPERRERVSAAVDDVLHHARASSLVVIESLVLTGPGRNADLIIGWGRIVHTLIRWGVPVAEVVGSSAKKAITDDGRADKAVVSVAMVKLYPDLTIESDDVGDAVGMAHLGAVGLGWDVPTLARHRAVKWLEWPQPAPLAAEVA